MTSSPSGVSRRAALPRSASLVQRWGRFRSSRAMAGGSSPGSSAGAAGEPWIGRLQSRVAERVRQARQ